MEIKLNCPAWYAMRTTYGREQKAVDFIINTGATAFYPTILSRRKTINGKQFSQRKSLLPNIFFLYATFEEAKIFAYDNANLPFLRFYYNRHHDGTKEPLIIPNHQIENIRIICEAQSEDTLLVPSSIESKFKVGQPVLVTGGAFEGIMGTVSRWHGQQRVGINIDGIGTIATAYVPTYFLKKINDLQ